jgi:hypothetical protein
MFPLVSYYSNAGIFSSIKEGDSSLHGGGVVETGIVSTNVDYAILDNDYIVNCTNTSGIIEVTLPNIITIGRVYRVYANKGSIKIIASGGKVINDNFPNITIKNYEMITLRLIETNVWRAGD